MPETILEVKSLSKEFPGVMALQEVDFHNKPGEIHALVGENGAGKSTLMKVIAGVYPPDKGELIYLGKPVRWPSPHASKAAGIVVIYQEFDLFPEMTVAENIYIGSEPVGRLGLIDYGKMREGSLAILRKLGMEIDPDLKIRDLTVAEQQMIEIAKALVNQTTLLILDEPTAVLSDNESDILLDRLVKLKEEGISIIYISHRLGEIFRIADRVTVLKDGRMVDTYATKDIDRNRLIEKMVGRDIQDFYPPKSEKRGDEALVLSGVSAGKVKNASLTLYKGEVLGLAGLVGSGRTDLAHGIFGSLPMIQGNCTVSSECLLEPVNYSAASPKKSIGRGISFLTENRKAEGLVLNHSVASNITISTLGRFLSRLGFIKRQEEKSACLEDIHRFSISVPGLDTEVVNLSGGNQQKVLFARWARACEGIFLLDEPTRGVDVGAKVDIYRMIRQLADAGIAVLMISSELPEIVGMCDRVVVMREGAITGELSAGEISEESIMRLATMRREDRPMRSICAQRAEGDRTPGLGGHRPCRWLMLIIGFIGERGLRHHQQPHQHLR